MVTVQTVNSLQTQHPPSFFLLYRVILGHLFWFLCENCTHNCTFSWLRLPRPLVSRYPVISSGITCGHLTEGYRQKNAPCVIYLILSLTDKIEPASTIIAYQRTVFSPEKVILKLVWSLSKYETISVVSFSVTGCERVLCFQTIRCDFEECARHRIRVRNYLGMNKRIRLFLSMVFVGCICTNGCGCLIVQTIGSIKNGSFDHTCSPFGMV